MIPSSGSGYQRNKGWRCFPGRRGKRDEIRFAVNSFFPHELNMRR